MVFQDERQVQYIELHFPFLIMVEVALAFSSYDVIF